MKEFSHPDAVIINGTRCGFTGYAPITGDALYMGISEKKGNVHGLVCNPHAVENQATRLNRGG